MSAATVASVASLGLMLAPAAAIADGEGPPPQPKPVNTAAPALSGTPAVGQTLTCSTGTWSNNPASYAYAWLRDGVAIAGQTGSTYVVQQADQGQSISCQVTATNSGGEYTIEGLPSGSYTVSFYPFEGNYLKQYYDGKASEAEATPFSVTVPNVTRGIDGSLAAGGQISGRVTAEESGTPIANIYVCAYAEQDERCDATNSNGEYTVIGLATGSYEVSFTAFGCYFEGCSVQNLQSQKYASDVAVAAGTTVGGIDAALATGGRIHGTVTFEGNPQSGVQVCANGPSEGCALTDSAGEYTVVGLAPGAYQLSFTRRQEGDYTSRLRPTTVSVAIGPAAEADETLEHGGEISGTVLAKGGGPLSEVQVCAYGAQDECAFSDANGEYVISGLPSSTSYEVWAYPNGCTEAGCMSRNFQKGSAASIPLTAPGKSVVRFELVPGGEIAGKVTGASGAPLDEVEVCAWESNADYEECASPNGAGEYTIPGLAESTGVGYSVRFEYFGGGNYLSQYYGGKLVSGEATLVPVSSSGIVSNVDATLAVGAQITGTVSANGVGVPDVWVCARGMKLAYAFASQSCAESNSGGGATTAGSAAVAVPAPISTFSRKGKAKFNPKTDVLEFSFEVSNPGTFQWSLSFQNADVGFADSLTISHGHGPVAALAKKRHGKGNTGRRHQKGGHAKKCTKGHVKHKGKCARKLVPFSTGTQSVATPGVVKIAVHPEAKALKALKHGDTLHVTGYFKFSSALGGSPSTMSVSAVAHGKKKGHGKKRHHEKGKKHQHHKKH